MCPLLFLGPPFILLRHVHTMITRAYFIYLPFMETYVDKSERSKLLFYCILQFTTIIFIYHCLSKVGVLLPRIQANVLLENTHVFFF